MRWSRGNWRRERGVLKRDNSGAADPLRGLAAQATINGSGRRAFLGRRSQWGYVAVVMSLL